MIGLSLRQLSAFVTVARLGSFTRAAAVLNISQPALTVQIQRVEEQVGTKLLDRSTHQVTLTPAGRDLFPVLTRLLEELELALAPQRADGSLRGKVRVGCFPSVAAYFLPQRIADYRRLHTDVTFLIHDTTAQKVLTLIRQEEVDFGIVDGANDANDLECTPLIVDHMHAIFPRHHPLEGVAELTIEALAEYPLILLDPRSHVRKIVDGVFLQMGRLTEPSVEVTYMHSAIELARAGLGIAILPALCVPLEDSQLAARKVDHPAFVRRMDLVKKRGASKSPAASNFYEFLLSNGIV
ncbi:LysR family transcriptional regulator [Novosphingobium sp. PP1Y]|uniref:LysR family transcriptional regulator n=1 Tax=Novosphingobium sp. PP1Y TaxID=702113 RepID=UPI00020EFAD0|nr:LysR family transcriptional regulator [Novosphingobium sp. PP1Y]CCA90021.1 LysR family transcriptional regulator [Novosphingobium sp. PP1Y]